MYEMTVEMVFGQSLAKTHAGFCSMNRPWPTKVAMCQRKCQDRHKPQGRRLRTRKEASVPKSAEKLSCGGCPEMFEAALSLLGLIARPVLCVFFQAVRGADRDDSESVCAVEHGNGHPL